MHSMTLCHDKDGQVYEISTSELKLAASIYAIIIRGTQVLLIPQHGDGYGLPGGRIELGESHTDALRREVCEETGYEIEVGDLIDIQTSFFRTNTSKRYIHSLLIFYRATICGGALSSEGLEPGERAWMSLAEWVDIDRTLSLKLYGSLDILTLIRSSL